MPLEKVVVVLILSAAAFLLAMFLTPFLSRFLVKFKCWKKQARTEAPDGAKTPLFYSLHKDKEVNTPRMAGLLIWGTTLLLALAVLFLARYFPAIFGSFNFVNRAQTWIPLFTLVSASLLGLADDIFVVAGWGKGAAKGGGIKFRHRLLAVFLISLAGAWWFYYKLGWDAIHLPFNGELILGFWYIPLFILVMIGLFSGSVIDGLDGLAGGVFAIIFGAFAAIAFVRGQYDLAAFCAVIAGATAAFLWNNIPPARFYMGETGILGLTTTLAVVAFLTNSVLLLPIIALVLFLEIGSVVLQLASKKLRHGKKIFLIAPLHHHFEAKGWPAYQVTMRFWLITGLSAGLGLIIFLVDRV